MKISGGNDEGKFYMSNQVKDKVVNLETTET